MFRGPVGELFCGDGEGCATGIIGVYGLPDARFGDVDRYRSGTGDNGVVGCRVGARKLYVSRDDISVVLVELDLVIADKGFRCRSQEDIAGDPAVVPPI